MIAWIEGIAPHWLWLSLGLVLAIGEMTIPGVFLIWMAGAAVVTGVVAWALPIGLLSQVMLFAVVSIVTVFMARNWLRQNQIESADPDMNDRGARSLGQVVVVTQVIENGEGRVKLGDSEWLARGPDAEPGTRMRISGNEGAVLRVEHLH
ncbi:MAG: NfeD family protein [Sphingomonadales bacterium]|nr:NfeD family protein [Sphingomonadaceae bacterium]MBS3932514.1 NfeD family protein [Sphingomonadales bacterium]MBX9643158.1 NfeD family protein [Novosphingobium sp.]